MLTPLYVYNILKHLLFQPKNYTNVTSVNQNDTLNTLTLKEEYTRLKNTEINLKEEEYNEELYYYDGAMHKTMKDLQEHLGKPRTPVQKVIGNMGKPYIITQKVGTDLMIEDYIGRNTTLDRNPNNGQPYYLIYLWRGYHDYLYFKIDPYSEEVISSGWFYSGE